MIWVLMCVTALAVMWLGHMEWSSDWEDVQEIKHECLRLAARHAVEQQKTSEAAPVPIPLPADMSGEGGVRVTAQTSESLSLEVVAEPGDRGRAASEGIQIELAEPLDMVSAHSGLAFTVATEADVSPELRIGCRLRSRGDDYVARIQPIVPALSRWGDNPHEVYLDWSFLDYADVEEAIRVLRAVDVIEITMASKRRAPERGASAGPRSGAFTISDLRLVDYLKGSYDPSRQWREFDEDSQKWRAAPKRDLTLQHRCQEVTGIVAQFGGDRGVQSAIDALDMAARTQCWDGSFLDGRRGPVTVASGEFTFGFTLYGLLCGYEALEQQRHSALDETVQVGPASGPRRFFYQRMFYRGAMARTIVSLSDHRDDIIGRNTLVAGANRVLGYVIAMRMIADALTDEDRKAEVLARYGPAMQEVAAAQGQFSGGFPLLGEGDRYEGRGIHYDAGYVRTHMDWLVLGVRRTGDPLLVQMLERYQTVFGAAMDETGAGILPMISERHPHNRSVRLILPDATAQIGQEYGLPVIAQWGHNCSKALASADSQGQRNHFLYASRIRGYPLGAHISILLDDLAAAPKPKDLGYLFPRQFPVWSSRLYTKDGELVRTSATRIHPDGSQETDFRIEVGEYPVTVGVPVRISSPDGVVTATADHLSGWPALLPSGAAADLSGDVAATRVVLGQPFSVRLEGPTHVIATGPAVRLPKEAGGGEVPFRAELTLTPERPGLHVELTVLRAAEG